MFPEVPRDLFLLFVVSTNLLRVYFSPQVGTLGFKLIFTGVNSLCPSTTMAYMFCPARCSRIITCLGLIPSPSVRPGALCHTDSIGLSTTYTWGQTLVTNPKQPFFLCRTRQGCKAFCHLPGPMAGLFLGPLFQRSRKTCVGISVLTSSLLWAQRFTSYFCTTIKIQEFTSFKDIQSNLNSHLCHPMPCPQHSHILLISNPSLV